MSSVVFGIYIPTYGEQEEEMNTACSHGILFPGTPWIREVMRYIIGFIMVVLWMEFVVGVLSGCCIVVDRLLLC